MKKWIIYSAIIGFFLSYNNWSTLYTGVISFLFAFIFTLFNFWLFQALLKFFGEYYGLNVELDRFTVKKEKKLFSHKIREIIVSERAMPLDYILTLLFGFATSGVVFPIPLSLKASVVESKRIGKTENYEVRFEERNKIVIFSIVSLWVLFSIVRNLSHVNPVVQAYVSFTFHFLAMLTWSCLTPFNLLLSYVLTEKLGWEFTGVSVGDTLLISKTAYYKAVLCSLVILPILGALLDPFSLLIVVLAIFSLVWGREKFKETFT